MKFLAKYRLLKKGKSRITYHINITKCTISSRHEVIMIILLPIVYRHKRVDCNYTLLTYKFKYKIYRVTEFYSIVFSLSAVGVA